MPSSVKPLHQGRHGLRPDTLRSCLVAMTASLLLAGCGLPLQKAAAGTSPPAPTAAVPPAPPQNRDAVATLLEHADRVRGLQGAELSQEIARLAEPVLPADQLRLAMALGQTRQLYDLVRAQDLLQRVLGNQTPEARPLHGLVRLLAARYAEQRRVEDQLDRQNQQLQGLQRRLGETQDKLDALKEIERSLTSRPAPAPAAPAAPASSPNGRVRPPGS